jgi:hypothetical protein
MLAAIAYPGRQQRQRAKEHRPVERLLIEAKTYGADPIYEQQDAKR